ncbi:MAG TPA: clostripain-related cysteine peptidase [Pyrinomonadaceae bacterium]|nr:clostripain-related cysteine peptidase [Pyrinomonadaceae bacterium]
MPDSTATDANRRIQNAPNNLPQKDKWTLMFLIAGDAALSASMISQLKELTDAGFQEHTNVLLYFDPNCNGKGARIYDVNHYRKQQSDEKTVIGDGPNPFVRNIAEDCNIQSLQQIPAALSLRYFLEYSRFYYPAENYMLFLMGHGVIVGNDEFLPDTDDGSSITLAELGEILKEFGGKVRATKGDEFHLVAFHSCGMSSVELAFELQGSARYMMGTQGSAFPGSWPYRQILKKIFNAMLKFSGDQASNTDEYPNPLVKEILKGLQNLSFYNGRDFSDAGFSGDLAMCSLDNDNVEGLKQPLKTLVRELKRGLRNGVKESILLAHWESQSYFGESYTDLYDFCECLQKHCPKGGSEHAIWEACEQVKDKLQSERCDNGSGTDPEGLFDRLVVFSDYYGPAFQHSNGLSIFFPWRTPIAKVTTNYENYEFTKELKQNSWLSFLNDYFFLTRRPLKGKDKPTKESSDKITTQAPLRPRMEKLSDAQLLRLGPPPRSRSGLTKRIALLVKELTTMAKETGALAEAGKETATLDEGGKETATLAKEMGTLAEKFGALAKEMGTLADSGKETATLAKEIGALEKEMASLAKETGTLEIAAKETGTLAKETATLAKETGSLAKETGTLADVSKETATLDVTGPPIKETATLAKETATLGFFGGTVIKNFDAPEGETISSRPRGRPNPDHEQTADPHVRAKARGR